MYMCKFHINRVIDTQVIRQMWFCLVLVVIINQLFARRITLNNLGIHCSHLNARSKSILKIWLIPAKFWNLRNNVAPADPLFREIFGGNMAVPITYSSRCNDLTTYLVFTGPPQRPTHLAVSDITNNSAGLHWTSRYDGGSQQYFIVFKLDDSGNYIQVHAKDTRYIHQRKDPLCYMRTAGPRSACTLKQSHQELFWGSVLTIIKPIINA